MMQYGQVLQYEHCGLRAKLWEERGALSYPLLPRPTGITPENYFRQAPSENQLILPLALARVFPPHNNVFIGARVK